MRGGSGSSRIEERDWIELGSRWQRRDGRDHIRGDAAVVERAPRRCACADGLEERRPKLSMLAVFDQHLCVVVQRAGTEDDPAIGR